MLLRIERSIGTIDYVEKDLLIQEANSLLDKIESQLEEIVIKIQMKRMMNKIEIPETIRIQRNLDENI